MRKFGILGVLIALAIVGCGGTVDNGSSTNGTIPVTDGSVGTTGTTGTTTDPNPFAGSYAGTFSGSNTTGATYKGTGTATIDADSTATFSFVASTSGVPISSIFTGTLTSTGAFTGHRNTGESATGTVVINGTTLTATLTWAKLNTSGKQIYTSTEVFTLNQSND